MASKVTTRGRKAVIAAQDAEAAKPPEGVKVAKRRRLPRKEIPTTQDQRTDLIITMMLHDRWDHRVSPFELAQKWGCTVTTIAKAAERAADRIVVASGNMERRVNHYLAELDMAKKKALKSGQFNAFVRAVELQLKTTGVFNKTTRPDRAPLPEGTGVNPRGLPPDLAKLHPPPSVEEVEHYAETRNATACPFEVCRVHNKEAPAPEQMH